jgi:predicted peroxiredoxin
MAEKVLINLATGLEDGERVTVAFLVAGAALERGREVAMFLTKEAVRLALPMWEWLGDDGGTVFSY